MKMDNSKLRGQEKVWGSERSEFKEVVQNMLKVHEKSEISFNEFMQLLGKFNIKFYSPEQFKKMSKIFNNTFHVLPTSTPFEYLQYHSKQPAGNLYYFLVRILHKKIDIFIHDAPKKRANHSVQKCMADFVTIMKKRYGNEINWFKVLGGMTVAVSIDPQIFHLNLTQIMKNTSHHTCIESIMKLFEQQQQKVITWNHFMRIIKFHIKKLSQGAKTKKSFERISHSVNDKNKTEFSEGFFTVKSGFFNSQNQDKTDKQGGFSRSEYATKRWTEQKSFFKSRCRTEGTEQLQLKLTLTKCPIYSKKKGSVSYTECSEAAYPIKKNTITIASQGNNEKRMQRNHFLWKYLKQKLQLQ